MPAATSRAYGSPPSFLELAGHPIRWSLLSELARSDRRVGELCARLELPQNLVSYHLGRLRVGEVVSRRRSAADARDSYYTVQLERCAELLAATGALLHPGLRLMPVVSAPTPQAASRHPLRLLFLCTGNSARSQMAEAFAAQLGGAALAVRSAGSRPKPLHSNAVRVMRTYGIDIAGRPSNHVDEFAGQRFDRVITLCDRVREVCPEFTGSPEVTHWSIADPGREGADDAETYPAFERTAREVRTRVRFLLQLMEPANHPSRR